MDNETLNLIDGIDRNIEVPSLLTFYCNMIELVRLRNEIILAATETDILSATYIKQCEYAGIK
jgi:hypothetical protein